MERFGSIVMMLCTSSNNKICWMIFRLPIFIWKFHNTHYFWNKRPTRLDIIFLFIEWTGEALPDLYIFKNKKHNYSLPDLLSDVDKMVSVSAMNTQLASCALMIHASCVLMKQRTYWLMDKIFKQSAQYTKFYMKIIMTWVLWKICLTMICNGGLVEFGTFRVFWNSRNRSRL